MRVPKFAYALTLCSLGTLPLLTQPLLLGLLNSPTAILNQDQVKIGALKFTPPTGWKPTSATSKALLAFAPPDLPAGKTCQIRVFADQTSTETFDAWFKRRWNALMSGKPGLRTSEALTQKAGALDLMVRSGAYQEGGGESYTLLLACNFDGHFIHVAYEANDFPTIEKYQDVVYAMFETMSLDGVGAPSKGDTGNSTTTKLDPIKNPADPTPNSKSNRVGSYVTGDPKAEQIRLNRLSEIAKLLQDDKQEAVPLMTEAIRLCGFSIRTEEGAKVSEPLGNPRLKLSITDTEIAEYAEMFRSRHSVVLADLIGMLDVVYKGIGSEPSCGPMLLEWLENGSRATNPSVRALNTFIQSLSAYRGSASAPSFDTGSEVLDPIQALLILRVATEEIGQAVRKTLKKEKPLLLASLAPVFQEAEQSGAAEDGYVGGVTGLYGSITDLTDKGKSYAEKVAIANAILSVLKFIATNAFLKGEIRVDAPGQPLIRTKDTDAGQVRKIIAKFAIKGSKVTEWMQSHRQLVALAGLDIDMPKSGVLKGVPTEWTVDQEHLVANQLIQTTRGGPALNNVITDDNGEAKVDWEGCPQLVKLDPKRVLPVNKQVWITVTPQVKEIKVEQDLVDAVTGAIGIKGGPTGFLEPLMEMLYRLKWKGATDLLLNVRDWQQADSIGQLKIETNAHWVYYTYDSALQCSIKRKLIYSDVGMMVIGADIPTLDPGVLARLNAEQRKQYEASMNAVREQAQKRTFIGVEPGAVQMSINDKKWFRGPDGCELTETTETTTWNGSANRPFKSQGAPTDVFHVEVDLAKKIVKVSGNSTLHVKFVSISKQDRITGRQDKEEEMGIFTGVTLQRPFSASQAIEFPLKETKVVNSDEVNYYGAISVPYSFGPGNMFKDNFIFSYSVTRKVAKAK